MKKAQHDLQAEVLQNSFAQFAPEHWGADRNWFVFKDGLCGKPEHDPTIQLITALASGDFATIDLDGKTDGDGVVQFRALLTVRGAHLRPKYSKYFYTDAQRCKIEGGHES